MNLFKRQEALSQCSTNIYGVIVGAISESAMTLFYLCVYTVYANQAIQAIGYLFNWIFVQAHDPNGIFHYFAPLAYPIAYIMNIQTGEIHRFSELVLRDRLQ